GELRQDVLHHFLAGNLAVHPRWAVCVGDPGIAPGHCRPGRSPASQGEQIMYSLEQFRHAWRRDQVFDFLLPRPEFHRPVDTSHGPILYVEDVSVSFDGFKALNNLNLYIDDGELRCIIGPNGAGKTTMMDVITGKTRPDSGSVFFGQRIDLLKQPEYQIARGGIGRKFQKPTIFEALSVFENLELATASDKGVWYTLNHDLNGEQRDRIDEVLTLIGLTEQRRQDAGALSHGQKQWLEI